MTIESASLVIDCAIKSWKTQDETGATCTSSRETAYLDINHENHGGELCEGNLEALQRIRSGTVPYLKRYDCADASRLSVRGCSRCGGDDVLVCMLRHAGRHL